MSLRAPWTKLLAAGSRTLLSAEGFASWSLSRRDDGSRSQASTESAPSVAPSLSGDRPCGNLPPDQFINNWARDSWGRSLHGPSAFVVTLPQHRHLPHLPGSLLPGEQAAAPSSCLAGFGTWPLNLVPRRFVYVEVKNDNIDRAIKQFKSRLKDEGISRIIRARQKYWKGWEMKRLKAKESFMRRKNKDFKEKLNWILAQKKRGF